MKKEYDSALLVKLAIPDLDAFRRYKLQKDETGKGHLRQCGYDWRRAVLNGYLPLPQQQQQQETTPTEKTKPNHPPRKGAFNVEDDASSPPPKHGGNSENQPRDEDDPRDHKQRSGGDQSQIIRYTIRKPSEFLAMKFDPKDIIWGNGYLEKSCPLAFRGQPGINKSRLILQFSICCTFEIGFLGWETNGADLKWLFLQTENGNKRLHNDFAAMTKNFTSVQMKILDDHIDMHALETDDDGFMRLNNDRVVRSIETMIGDLKPDIISWDPLRDFRSGNLDTDDDMSETLATIGQLTRKGNAKRTAIINHHAITGRIGIAKAISWDRTSFGRNSKALLGWVRAQINYAPYEPDANEVLVVSSAKCNNAAEFKPFVIELDKETMFFAKDDSITEHDIEEWAGNVARSAGAKQTRKKPTVDDVLALVPEIGLILKKTVIEIDAPAKGISKHQARALVDQLINDEKLFEHFKENHDSRRGRAPVFLGKYRPIPTNGSSSDHADNKLDTKAVVLDLIPETGTIEELAIFSKASKLEPPISKSDARGYLAELRHEGVISESDKGTKKRPQIHWSLS